MKRFLGVVFAVVLIASFSQAQLGKRIAVDALRITAYDSLNAQGPTYLHGLVHGTNAVVATVDSFTTTAVADTVTWAGAAVGDAAIVTPLVPAYSAVADTGSGQYGAYVPIGGGKVIVTRAIVAAGHVLKSAAIYQLILISLH